MADFYDVNAAIEKPDLLNSIRQGQQYGQAQEDRAELQHEKQLKQLRGAAKYMQQAIDTGNDAAVNGAWQSVRPFLQKLTGKQAPEVWDDSLRSAMEQAIASTQYLDKAELEGTPTGMREFEAKASAAGLKPGTPEYQEAANIALGRSPRAVTGAIKFDTMTDANGNPRPQRNNPANGGVEVFYAENNQWVPLGAAMGASTPPPPAAPAAAFESNGRPITIGADVDPRMAAAIAANPDAAGVADNITLPEQAPLGGNQMQTSAPISTLGVGQSKAAEAAASHVATSDKRQTLRPDEVIAEGLPPGTFAQRNLTTGEIEVGPAQSQPTKPMTEAQRRTFEQKAGKARSAMTGTFADLDRLKKAATALKSSSGLKGITGVYGAVPNFPGSAASNAEADLNALKSQIGFAVLQKMRQNSPTGGALGNVSDNEGARLEANLASLDKSQSLDQMQQRLQDIIDYVDSAKGSLEDAYHEQFSSPEAGGSAPAETAADAAGWSIQEVP